MGRPSKNNCDYFPHDAGMRNHAKIKAIRNKFPNGYAIWVMLLEYLTGSDGNVIEYSDLQFELLSGDFGFSVTEIRELTDYAIRLEMIFVVDGFINSDSLDERLAPVYAKRGIAKEKSAKQKRINGKFADSNAESTVVSVTEIRESKVNESKLNKTNNYKNILLSELSDSDVPNSEYLKITKTFYALIKNNMIEKGLSTKKLEKTKGVWYDDIRLLIDEDKQTVDNIRIVYNFLKVNDFWKKNILSTGKLRAKFTELVMAAKTPDRPNKPEQPTVKLNYLDKI